MNNWRHRWCFFLKLCWNNNSMMMIVSAAQHYERMTEHDFASRRATRHQHRPINAINGERASRSSSAYQHQIMQCNLVRRHLCVCLFFLIFFCTISQPSCYTSSKLESVWSWTGPVAGSITVVVRGRRAARKYLPLFMHVCGEALALLQSKLRWKKIGRMRNIEAHMKNKRDVVSA